MALWGVRTDGAAVAALKAKLEAEVAEGKERLRAAGLVRADGTRDMEAVRARVVAAYGGAAPKATPAGAVSTDAEVLKESGDEALTLLEKVGHAMKLLSTYVPAIERGTEVPLTSRPNVLVASGRTSWGDPNLQNPPRKHGVRECFVPRPGFVFAACDYDTLELRCLAQACLDLVGRSSMAEAIREGKDLHLAFAAQLLGISYEDAVARKKDPLIKKTRQEAKGFMFGRPGGLGADRMVDYLKASGTILDPDRTRAVEKARDYIARYHEAWPEIRDFFDLVSQQVGQDRTGVVRQLRSGRIRGGMGFTDGCNTYFQGMAADGAKAALYAVSRECYTGGGPLEGSRLVLFLHDELIVEVPEERAHEAAYRLRDLTIREMELFVPDVPITCSPVLMRRWFKGCEAVFVDGRLVPSKPNNAVVDGKEIVQWVAHERM